ncbi:AcrR family transcriptional regulator [Lipingzhangella halophila]|uniref:AcrR family transcriptional regulator n=1 Tax=Lipingzhangella halophila TaxID=1783352 RepID=A0A7W7RHN4_9ACTN|nr:TetR/AcrR family transcriptional regulator [Lipingzhangella halophila]MBB4932169.1 AcrR family transcriptional regulator [Lipingzhangella halophila]
MTKDGTPARLGAAPGIAAQSRRERVREATLTEIKEIARRHLSEQGASGVSLRAIARDMGMTAPGLYRYFTSLDDLMVSLQTDFYDELAETVRNADTSLPPEDIDGRLQASLRAFRAWALANRSEFALLFGPPGPMHPPSPTGPAVAAAQRFASTFFALFDRLLEEQRFAPPNDAETSPTLRRQLETFAERTGYTTENVSSGVLRVMMSCWVRVYGLVCMEVFQHLSFVMDDMEPLFEAELRDILGDVGVAYRAR